MKSRQASAACNVDLRARAGLARALHRLARAQQRLRRNASPVGALAADQLPLDDGDAQPARGQRRGAVLAGRPAAQDDHVVLAHFGSSVPACSATVYSPARSSVVPIAASVGWSRTMLELAPLRRAREAPWPFPWPASAGAGLTDAWRGRRRSA